jgi:pyroglutamyl-peptidase
MYGLLYHINKFSLVKKGGFIHVPFIPQQVLDKKNMPCMDLESIAKGLKASIKGIYVKLL